VTGINNIIRARIKARVTEKLRRAHLLLVKLCGVLILFLTAEPPSNGIPHKPTQTNPGSTTLTVVIQSHRFLNFSPSPGKGGQGGWGKISDHGLVQSYPNPYSRLKNRINPVRPIAASSRITRATIIITKFAAESEICDAGEVSVGGEAAISARLSF
jgi:hypothetical protein